MNILRVVASEVRKTITLPAAHGAAAIAVTFAFAYALPRIRPLFGKGIPIMSGALYMTGAVALLAINGTTMPVAPEYFQPHPPSFLVTVLGVAILAGIGLLSVLALREFMRMTVTGRKTSIEWYPLAISGYALIVLTQILITQFGMSFTNAAISIIYVLAALVWIVFGFTQRYSIIRKFGLGLVFFAIIKLFLADLRNLTQGYRIISYFALGTTLIAISFVYQYFIKRLEPKEPATKPGISETEH
jgi:hypothetical protein